MLYTRKGDKGETGAFGCCKRFSKSSPFAEALGAVDELNSLLGISKVKADAETAAILAQVQQNLFIIQAELARPVSGQDSSLKTIPQEKVAEMEKVIDGIEQELPPIKSFFVSGGIELAASLDYARAVARRAERRVVAVAGDQKVGAYTLAYLNRLSSLLYALARLTNHKSGIEEEKPNYS